MGAARPHIRKKHEFLWLSHLSWALLITDLASLALAFVLSFLLRSSFTGSLYYEDYLALAPALPFFPLIHAAFRLYPGTWLHPAEELKLLARSVSIGFCLLAVCFFLLKSADSFSRGFFLAAWLCALVLTPLARSGTRRFCHRFFWWRTPVIIIGNAAGAEDAGRRLPKHGRLGLTPVAEIRLQCPGSFPDKAAIREYPLYSLPFPEEGFPPEGRNLFASLAERHPGAVVFIFLDGFSFSLRENLLLLAGEYFYHLFLAPEGKWDYGVPDQVLETGNSIFLAVRRNLNDKRRLRFKRIFDLVLGSCLALASLPLLLALALCIRLDSSGPAFFRHTRIGQGGRPFRLFKFRTMRENADALLKDYLATHPKEAEEWAASRKLRHDPRVTRLGRLLRRTSLDELPQILNVLRGEMSLVGPRPIVQAEIRRYGEIFSLYSLVLPGITGLWQISGRNDCTYDQRINLDRSYVIHWSLWLDIYILAKTIPEIFLMRGAY
ncbi:MAG: undecaprenyl-phosphate galactose phosphotransferase WbaP [Desulfovibrio sp.]|jgi:Undecaprenyl-phosphate galactose phosphotransferase WbaP|nr:undecaprenyl-phosphate galactose phosphotransferase WbaP [Desulfovibrio sp.]